MKRRALFIGVDKYTEGLPPLSCACNDASKLRDFFQGAGYETDVRRDASTSEMLDRIEDLTRDLTKDDLFLFFFAGHGFTTERYDEGGVRKLGRQLAGKDDRKWRLQQGKDGLGLDDLKIMMGKCGCSCVVILDACQTRIGRARAGDGPVHEMCTQRDLAAICEVVSRRGKQDQTHAAPFVVINSCSVGEVSYELQEEGQGLFSWALLKVLESIQDGEASSLFDDGLVGRIVEQMKVHGSQFSQHPTFFCSGVVDGAFPSVLPLPSSLPPPSPYVVCPICGRYNAITEIFRCKVCGKDHLCLAHYSREHVCCDACATQFAGNPIVEPRPLGCPAPGDEMTVSLPGGVRMTFCWCPPGTFTMGSPLDEEGRCDNEVPHRVALTKGFWMGRFEVTQAQWRAVMEDNPSYFTGDDNRPVECVSWNECRQFVAACNAAVNGVRFALPTEAQWEYACRAGTTTPFGFGSTLNGEEANCNGTYPYGTTCEGCFRGVTAPAGSYAPNKWGLYDMNGNVWEWCADWYGDSVGDCTNPMGPTSGGLRVCRGGGWNERAKDCRSAVRKGFNPRDFHVYLGVRLVCFVEGV